MFKNAIATQPTTKTFKQRALLDWNIDWSLVIIWINEITHKFLFDPSSLCSRESVQICSFVTFAVI